MDCRIILKGEDLPIGTPVYTCRGSNMTPIMLFIDENDFILLKNDFIYEPSDELWASRMARVKWHFNPHIHPNYTLFQAIYSKLKLIDYF